MKERYFLFRARYVVFIITCLFALSFGLLWVPAALNINDTYKGRLVFDTVEEYTQFKNELALSGASLTDVTVLSSDPPILVEFDLRISQDYDFPYGEKSSEAGLTLGFGIVALVLILFGVYFSIALVADDWGWITGSKPGKDES